MQRQADAANSAGPGSELDGSRGASSQTTAYAPTFAPPYPPPPPVELAVGHRLAAGGAAGLVAQTATYPLCVTPPTRSPHASSQPAHPSHSHGVASALPPPHPLRHVVRRRMQAGADYSSIRQALGRIYTGEGVAGGLYKGLTLTLLKGPLQSALGFTLNDTTKRLLRERLPPVEKPSPW